MLGFFGVETRHDAHQQIDLFDLFDRDGGLDRFENAWGMPDNGAAGPEAGGRETVSGRVRWHVVSGRSIRPSSELQQLQSGGDDVRIEFRSGAFGEVRTRFVRQYRLRARRRHDELDEGGRNADDARLERDLGPA